jgi:hypothetical protein
MTHVLAEERPQDIFRAHEVDANAIMASSQNGPTDLRIGGLV